MSIKNVSLASVRPTYERIMIEREESKEEIRGGLIIPETSQEKPFTGTVIAVGPGTVDEKGNIKPLCVKKGDRVLFGKWSGTEITIDEKTYLIMKDSDVLAVL